MAIGNVQERVERSLYEVIRQSLVSEGYLPDITDPTYSDDPTGQAAWDAAMKVIQGTKGFAAEIYGHSSSLEKGNQRLPRIAIIPRRIMPGEIGPSIAGGFAPDPTNPDQLRKLKPPIQSSNFHVDINIVSGSAPQDRLLHSILAKALGTWSFIPMYDDPNDLFFIRQFNFYDLPDDRNGIEEKVYSFEIPDLYLYDGDYSDAPVIQQIKVYTWTTAEKNFPSHPITVPSYPYQLEGILVDLSGITFNLT